MLMGFICYIVMKCTAYIHITMHQSWGIKIVLSATYCTVLNTDTHKTVMME